MKEYIKRVSEVFLWSFVYFASIVTIFLFSCMIDKKAHYRHHEYEDIRHIWSCLQNVLDNYVSDERYSAIADTDEKMRAYKSLDDIIETELRYYNETEGMQDKEPYNDCLYKIFEGPKEYGKNSFERLPSDERFCFEEEVVRSFQKYIDPKGNDIYFREPKSKKFKGWQFWILIQGSYEEGYTVMVLPDKKDPFSEVR